MWIYKIVWKKHFYNRILHFNEDSILWCYNHEKFEVVKRISIELGIKPWNDIASDWILY